MFKNPGLILGAIVATTLISPPCRGEQPPPALQGSDSKEQLEYYLAKMGVKLDCYFTLEKRGGDPRSPLFSPRVTDDQTIGSVSSLASRLHEDLPGVTISLDQQNPAIVHLIEESLMLSPDYALPAETDLTYSGSLDKMRTSLAQHLNGRVKPRRSYTTMGFFDDWGITQVSFKAKGLTVRAILSDYLPLSQYQRLLWNADTREVGGKLETTVQYYGPAHLSALRRRASSPVVSFGQGEVAYANNPNSGPVVTSAIDFINAQMKQDEPHQVRWAMLYLGKNKVESGIPVLLKYLDYQYTPVPILEERFPALRALAAIGKPAQEATLGMLVREDNQQRLELLCRVVLAVAGAQEGSRLVGAAADGTKDAARQAKVRQAWTTVTTEPVATAYTRAAEED